VKYETGQQNRFRNIYAASVSLFCNNPFIREEFVKDIIVLQDDEFSDANGMRVKGNRSLVDDVSHHRQQKALLCWMADSPENHACMFIQLRDAAILREGLRLLRL